MGQLAGLDKQAAKEEKDKLIQKFQKDKDAAVQALESERDQHRSKLEEKLAKRKRRRPLGKRSKTKSAKPSRPRKWLHRALNAKSKHRKHWLRSVDLKSKRYRRAGKQQRKRLGVSRGGSL